jgi:hypothetical protein
MAQSSDTSDVDPQREALLGVLANHRVVFVLIGGAAIQSHGRRYDTLDIDLTRVMTTRISRGSPLRSTSSTAGWSQTRPTSPAG